MKKRFFYMTVDQVTVPINHQAWKWGANKLLF